MGEKIRKMTGMFPIVYRDHANMLTVNAVLIPASGTLK